MEIFRSTRSRTASELDAEENEISDEDELLLRKAYLLTKSVPRQSNRVKWRERSGYQPNLLSELPYGSNQILSGDMVFSRGLEGELLFLLVQENIQLNGKTGTITVCQVGQSSNITVLLNKLLLDKGLIAIVPSRLFKITENSDVVFDELAQDLITSFTNTEHTTESHADEEWALLLDDVESDVNVASDHHMEFHCRTGVSPIVNTSDDSRAGVSQIASTSDDSRAGVSQIASTSDDSRPAKRKNQGTEPPSKKRRRVIESDSEDDGDDQRNHLSLNSLKAQEFDQLKELPINERVPLQWVKVIYDGMIFLGKIQNVHPITGNCLVKCLNHPFGVNEGAFQDLESDEVWYEDVYMTDVVPEFMETEGKTQRQRNHRYIYGKLNSSGGKQ